MNNRLKSITVNLAEEIDNKTRKYLKKHLKETELLSDVLNVILNAHYFSLSNCMRSACAKNPESLEYVNLLLYELDNFLTSNNQMNKYEYISE